MQNDRLERKVDTVVKGKNRKRIWQRVAIGLASVAVFCTTYALILPAITISSDDAAICGMVNHQHDDSCYAEQTRSVYSCSENLHEHTDSCFDADGKAICGIADFYVHSHDDACFNADDQLVCPLPVVKEHTHTAACRRTEEVYICGQVEGHTHGDGCYSDKAVLNCKEDTTAHVHGDGCYETALTCQEEHEHSAECYTSTLTCSQDATAHVHTDACYTMEPVLTCQLEENHKHNKKKLKGNNKGCKGDKTVFTCEYIQADYHVHSESCSDEDGKLACGKVETLFAPVHEHTDDCRLNGVLLCGQPVIRMHAHSDCAREVSETVLTCTLPEHEHDTNCYSEQVITVKYSCDYEYEHTHSESCYRGEELVCSLDEHTHTDACKQCTCGSANGEHKETCPQFYTENQEPPRTPVAVTSPAASDGSTMSVKGFLPEGAAASIQKGSMASSEMIELFGINKFAAMHSFAVYDLSILAEGEAIQPDSPVTVTIENPSIHVAEGQKMMVGHVKDGSVVDLKCTVAENGSVTFVTDGFSTYVLYTVDFHYGDKTFSINGRESILLSELFTELSIDRKVGDVAEVTFSDASLLTVERTDSNDWRLTSLAPFTSNETLTITFADGEVMTLRVTDYMPETLTTATVNGQQIALERDVEVNEPIVITENTTIDLNGHKLTSHASNLFILNSGATLTITDSAVRKDEVSTGESGKGYDFCGETASYDADTGKLTYSVMKSAVHNSDSGETIETQEEHVVSGGMIVGGSGSRRAILMKGGTLNLDGGIICNFNAGTGAADGSGAAVMATGGIINVNGDTVIAANKAANGGAIALSGLGSTSAELSANPPVLNVNGGYIAGNVANGSNNGNAFDRLDGFAADSNTGNGGGVFAAEGAIVNVNGGYITNNKAHSDNYYGGGGAIALKGIFLGDRSAPNGNQGDPADTRDGTSLNINGGYLTGNWANSGGGAVCTASIWMGMSQDITPGYRSTIIMRSGFISGNRCVVHEGGGISIEMGSRGYFGSGNPDKPGYISNNRCDTPDDWGGGGLFNSGGSTAKVIGALVSENFAQGFGGGVAGCSTGRLTMTVAGIAIFDNKAEGVHASGATSSKRDDWLYMSGDMKLDRESFQDYFCALFSKVYGAMMGGGTANWSGSVDGVLVNGVPADAEMIAQYGMALKANPSEGDKRLAQNAASLFVNGNYSNTHGGGILSNGHLLGGEVRNIEMGDRIELGATKALINNEGLRDAMEADQFHFTVTDESGTVIAHGKNDADGKITFDRRLSFSHAGNFTFFLSEDPVTEGGIQKDYSVYRIKVHVVDEQDILAPAVPDMVQVTTLQHKIKAEGDTPAISIETRTNGDIHSSIGWSPVEFSSYIAGDTMSVSYIYDIIGSGGSTFVNSYSAKGNVTVKKQWQDSDVNHNNDVVTVQLMDNGSLYSSNPNTVTLNAGNNWTKQWIDLPVYDSDGNYHTYTVVETRIIRNGVDITDQYVASYTSSYGGDSTVIWVPVTDGRLVAGENYIIVDDTSKNALFVTNAHYNDLFTANDKVSIADYVGTSTANVGSTSYPAGTYFNDFTGLSNKNHIIFTPQSTSEHGNTRTPMKVKSGDSWLLAQSANGLKGTNSINYSSGVKYENGQWMIQKEWTTGNSWFPIVYDFDSGIFRTECDVTIANKRNVTFYHPVVSRGSADKVLTVTNTPPEQVKFRMNLTKISNTQVPQGKDEDGNTIYEDLFLAGAEFELYHVEELSTLAAESTPGTLVHFSASKNVYTFDESGSVTTLVTGSGGTLAITELPGGKYILRETKAPYGYSRIPDQEIVLNGHGDNLDGYTYSFTFKDEEIPPIPLPETGGRGTAQIYALGGATMVTAAFLLVVTAIRSYRRKKED